MQCVVESIFIPNFSRKVSRPLFSSRVSAGFPSPAENYIEGRIDLNKDLIHHQLSTFYIRVIGDSMEPLIFAGELLIVDKMCETKNNDIVVARLGDDLCVKRLRIFPDGNIWLFSDNINYRPIPITAEDVDFEVWGKVLHSIKSFK
jgi:DNA polymerase V